MEKMNVMTRGFSDLCADSVAAAKFGVTAMSRISESEPSMVVSRSGIDKEFLEDGGRTLVLPVDASVPKMYCCLNETGGSTLMLASEY